MVRLMLTLIILLKWALTDFQYYIIIYLIKIYHTYINPKHIT